MPTIRLPANGWQPRWYQRPAWDAWERGCKRLLLVWHRRAGKDDINLHMHAVAAHMRVGTYWHMLPEASQARKAIWEAVNPHTGKRRIDEAFPLELRDGKARDNDMLIRFKNGSTWQVVGSDNFNSLVGAPPVGITFSEWALANPAAYAHLAPILVENGGWASFISTPRGDNHLRSMYDQNNGRDGWYCEIMPADKSGAIGVEAIEETRREYIGIYGRKMAEMLIDQEFNCSFAGAQVGAYYAEEMDLARKDGRIARAPYDPAHKVHTAWDLGVGDSTAIWCVQVVGLEIRVIDYITASGEGPDYYAKELKSRPYVYGTHLGPHDAEGRVWAPGAPRRMDYLQQLGINMTIVPRSDVDDGIAAVRRILPRCVFDQQKCEAGISALQSYRRNWDERNKVFSPRPLHDWASHGADAFRYLAVGLPQVERSDGWGSAKFQQRRVAVV